MVLETILINLKEYVFGSWILLGFAILVGLIIISIYSNISISSMLLLFTPLVIAFSFAGYLPTYVTAIMVIGIMMLWGIFFKYMVGKKD